MKTLEPTPDDIKFFEAMGRELQPSIRERMVVERAVIRKACTDLIAAGMFITVDYGEGEAGCTFSKDINMIMSVVQACDDEILRVYRPHGVVKTKHGFKWNNMGWIRLVYGNDGYDVIADHTMSLSELLKATDAYADSLSE